MRRTWLWILLLACAGLNGRLMAESADSAAPAEANAPDGSEVEKSTAPGENEPLPDRQKRIRQRFSDLEKLLLRMAELTAPTDPQRAALLRRAVAQSKQRDVDTQFEKLVELLQQQRLALAVEGQGDVQRDLAQLLDLLLSEDRSKRITSEKERIRQYLKRVNKIIKEQKSVQGRTARGGDAKPLADEQGELSDKTGELAEDIHKDETERRALEKQDEGDPSQSGGDESSPEGDSSEPGKQDESSKPGSESESDKSNKPSDKSDKPSDKPKESGGDEKPSDQPNESGEPGEPNNEDSSKQPSQGTPGKPGDQPPMPGEQNPGQGQPGETPQQDNPAQQRLQQAEQRMREAQDKLEQAQREDAADKQAEAIRELERAKAELEEILRQLREEEMARMLAMLESRFRKMLDAQVEVYEGTKRVDGVPQDERDRDDEIEAGRLSRKEAEIVVAADKCLVLLREEGSAVAFPEAVVEMREDMQQVVDRLAQTQVGELTQAIETDIIAALEEMISALKKAQKDLEDKQRQPPNQGQVASGEPPLVDALAELRMIRALQMRVNKRTQQYAKLTEKDQADTPEMLEALRKLADREERIHKVTRDIVVGRNR